MAGTTGAGRLPRITHVDDKLQPTWASDAGRNTNSGAYSGTFLGYFTDLEITFGRLTQAEMTKVKSVLEPKNGIIKNFTYINTRTGEEKTEDFYGTVISAAYSKEHGKYESFSVELIGVVKRNDI